MKWFSASIFYSSAHSKPAEADDLWEESICLVQASTEEEALEKAKAIGARSVTSYPVSKDDAVEWRFVKVERVFEIRDEHLNDGVEIFSRFLRAAEAESLLLPFEPEGLH